MDNSMHSRQFLMEMFFDSNFSFYILFDEMLGQNI